MKLVSKIAALGASVAALSACATLSQAQEGARLDPAECRRFPDHHAQDHVLDN